ncbi:MAG: hypothetical protein FJ087_03795 [Deltaproteobacteria bacterium]|nr:hypothetical protein [Deltaproteobacteria bacterium]
MMRNASPLVGGVAALAALAACAEPTEFPTRVVHRAVDITATCADVTGAPLPIAGCTGRVTIWVADADVGGLSIMSASSGAHRDADPFVPGFTSAPVGDDIVAVAASPDSTGVYSLLRGPREVRRLDPGTLATAPQAIPCRAEAMEVAAAGPLAGSLIVACAEPPGVVSVPFAGFGRTGADDLAFLPVTGRPRHVAVSGDGTAAWITHTPMPGNPAGWLTRLDLATGAEERAGIVPACSDGLDNDGDGKTDAADPGCSGPDDDSEAPDAADPCANLVDEDGDGLTDADDPNCPISEFLLVPVPQCGNGLDDDGDGLTDFGGDPDCYGRAWPLEAERPRRVAGRPAVSPDGAIVYVPMSAPDGIVVLRTSPLARVDVNGPGAPFPNPLLARLGFRDVLLNAGATEAVMTTATTGSRAFVTLSSGQIVRAVVTEAGAEQHRVGEADSTVPSAATAPDLRVAGIAFDRGASLHPEHASFGPSVVSLVPGTGRYSYYGVVFNGNPLVELTETWRVTYEGRLPGAASASGFFAGTAGRFADPSARFCDAGVEPGDLLVLLPAVRPECAAPAGVPLEFRVARVASGALTVESLAGGAPLPDPAACLGGAIPYEVRAADSWTVVGTRSGFLHNLAAGPDGGCVQRPDAGPGFTARARTSLPVEGTKLAACPPLPDAPDVAWLDFANVAFRFRLFPPCETSAEFVSSVIPESRDTELSFTVLSGHVPDVVSIGGVPVGAFVLGASLWVFDAGSGFLAEVDTSSMSIRSTAY